MRIVQISAKVHRPILVEVMRGHRVWMTVPEVNAIVSPRITRLSAITHTKPKYMKKIKQIIKTSEQMKHHG